MTKMIMMILTIMRMRVLELYWTDDLLYFIQILMRKKRVSWDLDTGSFLADGHMINTGRQPERAWACYVWDAHVGEHQPHREPEDEVQGPALHSGCN